MRVRFQAKRWNCISVSWLQEVAHHNWDQASVLVGSESLTRCLIVHVAMLGVAFTSRMREVSLSF